MKKILFGFFLCVSMRLFAGGDQFVLQDGKPCSLTVDDLARIDSLERHYETVKSRKRNLDSGLQESEIKRQFLNEEVEKDAKPIFIEALFTREGAVPIQDRLIELIKQEKKGIRGAEYVFANGSIAKAISEQVKHEGVEAQFLVDRGFKGMHSTNCLISLINNGIGVRVPLKPEFKKLMHDKFLIFEDNNGQKVLVTGSYNISYQANKNDENIVITNNPVIVAQFEQKLDELMASSHALQQKVSSQGVPLGSLQSCPTQQTQSLS